MSEQRGPFGQAAPVEVGLRPSHLAQGTMCGYWRCGRCAAERVVTLALLGGLVVFGMIVLDAVIRPHGLGHDGRECR